MEFPVTIDSQDDFDSLVKDRLSRERAKFSDYDDLKTRAEKADEEKSKAESAIAEATARAEAAEGKVSTLEAEKQVSEWRSAVAADAGIPADVLRGSTKEEFEAHAATLKPLITAQTGPVIPSQGNTPGKPAEPTTEGEFVTNLFGGGN